MGAVTGAARGAAAGAAAAGAAATGAGGGKLDGANTTGGPASGRARVMPVSRLLRISASCQKASMTARGGRGAVQLEAPGLPSLGRHGCSWNTDHASMMTDTAWCEAVQPLGLVPMLWCHQCSNM